MVEPADTNRAMSLRRRSMLFVVLLVTVALAATNCRVSDDAVSLSGQELPATSDSSSTTDDSTESAIEPAPIADPPAAPPSNLPRDLTAADISCAAPGTAGTKTGLTTEGEAMFARYLATDAIVPSYQLAIDVDPATGEVAGAMRAEIPVPDRTINFRVFPGMDAFDAGLEINNVTQDGSPADATLTQALLSMPTELVDSETTVIELDFRFMIDQMAANENLFGALSGDTLQPDQVGLLGRTETGMQLGHWFPVWLPDGIRTDPDPSGFGDIGAFPAANICATITVPPGYQTVTGGSLVSTSETSITEAGTGLRDFAILISNDLSLSAAVVDGVEIRVWGPSDDPEAILTVLDYAEQSQRSLSSAFGPYPWKEIDLVAAPLGGGVGGMEWPGMIWIEQSMFGGGLPGMGEFGDLLGDGALDSLLAGAGGVALTTSLEWTVAHELGHEWWHATVGNDSIESPAVDEPLAQFSACLAMIDIHPDNWREICEAQTTDQYAQARALGIADTAAEQPSDAFESSIQYGAIVYGKAPGFYFEAADLIGWNELADALKSFVSQNSFALVSTDALRSHLVAEAGSDGPAIAALWDRWFRETKGDEDIEPTDLFGSLGGLEGLEGLEGFDLEGLEDLNIDELLEGIDLENLDLEALLGEDADVFSDLLEGLLEDSAN